MSGGSFNPAGSSFGHIGFNHRTDSWDATTDYAEGDTVLYAANGSTYYCHTSITGDAANSPPSEDATHWYDYTSSALILNSATATNSSDLLAKFSDAVNRVAIGSDGERLYYSADNEIGWYNPAAGNTRQNIATRTNPGTLPVSERYAAREELETVYFAINSSPRYSGVNSTHLVRYSSKDVSGFTYSCVVDQLKYGFFNDSGNNLGREGFSGSELQNTASGIGVIRDGRFFRHPRTTHYNGLFDLQGLNPNNSDGNATATTTPSVDIRMASSGTEWDQAGRLDASGMVLNRDDGDLEWKIFNEADSPNDRNLHVLDYIRGTSDNFTFLCAPADDPTSTTRTIWQIGGIEMRFNAQFLNGYFPNTNTTMSNSSQLLFAGSDQTYVQYGFLRPIQFRYRRTTLTQIAVAGNYEKIFLLDEGYQFNSPFFVGAENMSVGSGFLAKMQDGSWELHAGINSAVSGIIIAQTLRTSTSTALQTYPAHVVTRDHVCVSDPGYAGYTGSMLYWNGSTGHTNASSVADLRAGFPAAIRWRHFFNAWKSGQSVVSIQHGNVTLTAQVGTLTVGNNETVKQIKCFNWWFPRSGDGMDTSNDSRHPTDGTLTVFVVTEEGNLWVAANTNNNFNPLGTSISIPALPTGTNNVNMVQLPGDWDGLVERVEIKVATTLILADLDVSTNASSSAGWGYVRSSVAIVTRKSIFVHSYESRYVRNSPRSSNLNSRPSMFLTNQATSSTTRNSFFPVCCFQSWTGTESTSAVSYLRWSRGDLPIGDIERVFFTDDVVVVINTFGDMYIGRFALTLAADQQIRLSLCRNSSSRIFGNAANSLNREV